MWGRCGGSAAEPYDVAVDHIDVAMRCSCPSRIAPCKHALALLLLWVRGHVAERAVPESVTSWIASRRVTAPPPAATTERDADGMSFGVHEREEQPPPPLEPPTIRDDRLARMSAGIVELQRWLADRMRRGLTDPSLSRYATWDALAAQLVDAQVGGLANRVRRIAGAVGVGPLWHERVLAELGVLHLLAAAGLRVRDLPADLGDSVAAAIGWQVRQAHVLAGVPHTAAWQVRGRSDTREDRIEVRRHWLYDPVNDRWCMPLSFAAYGQSLDDSLPVGSVVHADVFRYPGALGLRALIGTRHGETAWPGVVGVSIAEACAQVGAALAVEPWIERYPATVHAAPTFADGTWWLSDRTGALPIQPAAMRSGLLATTGGALTDITCEWTADGLVPLAVHLPDRTVDLGPTADPGFVRAA